MFKEFLELMTPPDDDFQEDDLFPEQSETGSEEVTREESKTLDEELFRLEYIKNTTADAHYRRITFLLILILIMLTIDVALR
ncbi:MAG: hypothetical protein K5848_00890 [Lachnospiraceae bacterium]|nr:hypothetical protein [Lachnospiraceae bacterium]